MKIWIKQGDLAPLEKNVPIRKLTKDEERVPFEATAVGADRIGFMLYKLEVPKSVKEAYIQWESSMYLLLWNRVAPYIALERRIREGPAATQIAFTPFFEQVAYESYKYYLKQDKNAKLVSLTSA